MYKFIAVAIIASMVSVGVTEAASNVIKTTKKWGEVVTPSQTTSVYQLRDTENGVVCYFSYISGNANTPPVVSCVKVQ